MYIVGLLLGLVAWFSPKVRVWYKGRKNWKVNLRNALDPNKEVIWVHSASLGEFEQGRSVIEKIRRDYPQYQILLTFFSPSGYEVRKNYSGVDYVCYLPLDTLSNAKAFTRIAKPKVAIFIKYEFWINLLTEAHKSGCRLFVISAIFRQNSIFFKPYAGIFRSLLRKIECLFVQNEHSKKLLNNIGINNVIISGDTRFDRVAKLADQCKELPLVESFVDGKATFIGGSTWPEDENLIEQLINKNPDCKFIIAPHQIVPERIEALRSRLECNSCLYTQTSEGDDLSSYRVLFIDTIGILSSVYRYGTWAMIGGGFGVGIHNTLEAATFGLPLVFGTNYLKFAEARALVSMDLAISVENFEQMEQWFEKMSLRGDKYSTTKQQLLDFVASRVGATELIIENIFAKKQG